MCEVSTSILNIEKGKETETIMKLEKARMLRVRTFSGFLFVKRKATKWRFYEWGSE